MAKKRVDVPDKTRDQVLKEFNHRCAVCGTDRPQIHHIDENPSNNDPLNLIPLCPNCHLIDQHNPTAPVDPEKLRLFRQYKDPAILKPQFHPLFMRLQFLNHVDDTDDPEVLDRRAVDVVEFVEELEMGAFYSARISELIRLVRYADVWLMDSNPHWDAERAREAEQRARDYRSQLRSARERAFELAVELLRFQRW